MLWLLLFLIISGNTNDSLSIMRLFLKSKDESVRFDSITEL